MAASAPRTASEKLRAIASDVNDLADRYADPSRSIVRAERLIADVEQCAFELRAVARGR